MQSFYELPAVLREAITDAYGVQSYDLDDIIEDTDDQEDIDNTQLAYDSVRSGHKDNFNQSIAPSNTDYDYSFMVPRCDRSWYIRKPVNKRQVVPVNERLVFLPEKPYKISWFVLLDDKGTEKPLLDQVILAPNIESIADEIKQNHTSYGLCAHIQGLKWYDRNKLTPKLYDPLGILYTQKLPNTPDLPVPKTDPNNPSPDVRHAMWNRLEQQKQSSTYSVAFTK